MGLKIVQLLRDTPAELTSAWEGIGLSGFVEVPPHPNTVEVTGCELDSLAIATLYPGEVVTGVLHVFDPGTPTQSQSCQNQDYDLT